MGRDPGGPTSRRFVLAASAAAAAKSQVRKPSTSWIREGQAWLGAARRSVKLRAGGTRRGRRSCRGRSAVMTGDKPAQEGQEFPEWGDKFPEWRDRGGNRPRCHGLSDGHSPMFGDPDEPQTCCGQIRVGGRPAGSGGGSERARSDHDRRDARGGPDHLDRPRRPEAPRKRPSSARMWLSTTATPMRSRR
jgi:hypothetical protein